MSNRIRRQFIRAMLDNSYSHDSLVASLMQSESASIVKGMKRGESLIVAELKASAMQGWARRTSTQNKEARRKVDLKGERQRKLEAMREHYSLCDACNVEESFFAEV